MEKKIGTTDQGGAMDWPIARVRRGLEESEARYHTLRRARPDLAAKIQQIVETKARPPKKDKYKHVTLIEKDKDEGSARDREFTSAERIRGQNPCLQVGKATEPAKGVRRFEQTDKFLIGSEGKTAEVTRPQNPHVTEMNGRPYCKWHDTFTHATNDCKVLRGQIQMAIEQGRLLFDQFAMKADTQPFRRRRKAGVWVYIAGELEEIEEVKKEIKKLLDAGFIRQGTLKGLPM
ncbi:hypothetical protein QYE76_065229 [Lolium multiflorum]|uniref:Uncharacterized protein n=1 Tax=Lolium multiflorum TaxID=4521 RepID=A0AAD8S8Z4_LOLMU|nr:hypothetical protein QYE76_065229 [Lolium multiflorum]